MSVNRNIVDWRAASPRGSDKTEYVILDTGEKMTSVASIEANKTATISANGTVTVSPSSGYDSMAKATLTVNVNKTFYAWVKTEGGVTNYVYTIKQEPTAGDSAYGPNPDSGTDNIFQLLRYDIDSASLVTITIDGKPYSRAVAANITL